MAINSYVNINLIPEPVSPKHLVTREFVENLLSGKIKAPVRVVSTSDEQGTYHPDPDFEFHFTAAEALEIDGVKLDVGDRLLLTEQADGTQNGIYIVVTAGEDGPTPPAEAAVIKRAPDFTASEHIEQGQQISVMEGATQANSTWRMVTGGVISLDATSLEFLSITPATGASVAARTIVGNSVDETFEVKHDLASTDVTVNIFKLPDRVMVLCDVEVTDANNIEVSFAEAPTPADQFRVVVTG